MEILLVKKASGNNYSIEAGISDGVKNFDHHREHSANPAPCNDPRIKEIDFASGIIEITHTDADTIVGVMRMWGVDLPNLNFAELEKIDLNGSSVVKQDSLELAYMAGVEEAYRSLDIPLPSDQPQNITDKIARLLVMLKDYQVVIRAGKIKLARAKKEYDKADKKIFGKVLAIFCAETAQIDPSMGYVNGFDVVVFFRNQYKSISLYANPKTKIDFMKNSVYDGIPFNGHQKACGSPRGTPYSWDDAVAVAKFVYGRFDKLAKGE